MARKTPTKAEMAKMLQTATETLAQLTELGLKPQAPTPTAASTAAPTAAPAKKPSRKPRQRKAAPHSVDSGTRSKSADMASQTFTGIKDYQVRIDVHATKGYAVLTPLVGGKPSPRTLCLRPAEWTVLLHALRSSAVNDMDAFMKANGFRDLKKA